tara:strand:- start:20762 stop:22006 length:1245 start_codon:yes stop_codon:yes gene_type:complete
MSEDDQRAEIQMTQSLADDLVRKVVEMVASGSNSVIHALLDNFKIKDGLVTITAKGAADDGAVLALNSVGKKALKIVVADAEQFDVDGREADVDSDQPSMLPDGSENDYSSDDALYADIVKFTISTGKCSSSEIQRKFNIGYNKAARFVERMEKEGIVSASDHVGKREVLFTNEMQDDEANDIAAAMDADLDDIEEPDDMHVDLPDEPSEPESDPVSDAQVAGYHARMQGHPLTSGPDIDAAERDDWYLGWKKADGEEGAPDIVEADAVDETHGPDQETQEQMAVEQDAAPDSQEAEASDEPAPQEVTEIEKPIADQEEAADVVDLGGLSPKDHGAKCRLNDGGKDENPFDGGTDESTEWIGGYDYADGEVEQLKELGYKAAADGDDPTSSKWKAGSDAERFWLQGFNSFKPDS